MNNTLRFHLFLLAVLFLGANTSFAAKQSFPAGWRQPNNSDYSEITLQLENNKPPKAVEADFNGDGQVDNAYILINDLENKNAVFVFWGTKSGESKVEKLEEDNFNNQINWGISLLPPGKHQTACGKGYYECDSDEPKEIILNNPGLTQFMLESAMSVYYWDSNEEKPKHIWLSD